MRSFLLFIFLIASAVTPLSADVKLPAIFGDHMVLQRNTKVPIWGWADPLERVTVTAGSMKATSTADADGKWFISLESLKASAEPMDLTVAGKNMITLHDVLVGDVWVCSGQSNMEFNLGGGEFGFGGAHNAVDEIPKANHPTLRFFVVARKACMDPVSDCEGQWRVCAPETAPKFSAVGYFFGREILKDQQAPVGLIGAYWSATPAESWTRLDALKTDPALGGLVDAFEKVKSSLPELKRKYETEILTNWQKDYDAWDEKFGKAYREHLKKWNADVAQAKIAGQPLPPKPKPAKSEPRKPYSPDSNPNTATLLYNGMIAPIIPYAIKGVIWYQGEANTERPVEYETLFSTLIRDWRNRWGEGDFPFLWVQLANCSNRNSDPIQSSDGWPGLRDAQRKTLKLPHTGQAVAIDLGVVNDVHPTNKLDVGCRLALAARRVAYGEELVYSGPTYDSMQVQGGEIRLKFKNIGSGLIVSSGPSTQPKAAPAQSATELKGFSIAGEDRKFIWAQARIEGDSIIVSNPEVKEPKAVRYGWAKNPEVNLYNRENLPASPFRTDDWTSNSGVSP